MKKFFYVFSEFLQIIIISLLIIIPIRYFVVQPFFVKGSSMEPSFHDRDYLIIDELTYHFRSPKRGEVIVFKYPHNPSQFYIKRVIGLPEERIVIEQNKIYIYNNEHPDGFLLNEDYISAAETYGNIEKTLGQDEYFVMGDNRLQSSDSRRWGGLDENFIVGKVLFRVWPLSQAMAFSIPHY